MSKHMLIVDDEIVLLKALGTIFQCPAVIVDLADSYEGAIALLEREKYDVIITDVRLSKNAADQGLDVVRYAKGRNPSARVIVQTAYDINIIREKAYSLGADTVYEKPVSSFILKHDLDAWGIESGRRTP